MSSTKSVEVNLINRVHDFFSGDNSAHREAVSDTFSHSDNIGLDALPFEAPPIFADSSETSLHLIADDKSSMTLNELSHLRDVAFRIYVDSSNTLHRFENPACKFATKIS